jgi:hypothetical protein
MQFEATLEFDDWIEVPDSIDLADEGAVCRHVHDLLEAAGTFGYNIVGERIDFDSIIPITAADEDA